MRALPCGPAPFHRPGLNRPGRAVRRFVGQFISDAWNYTKLDKRKTIKYRVRSAGRSQRSYRRT